jgi:hypothetical protein
MSDHGPGIDALDAALSRAYPGAHLGWVPFQSEQRTLNGIAAIAVDGPEPHFLFVTYGLSDLYGSESEDPAVSGFGFELTLRVARAKEERKGFDPWCRSLLEYLASYVNRQIAFRAGDNFDLGNPISEGSQLEALVFASDPVLSQLSTPNGTVNFLQCVLLTRDEFDAVRAWRGDSFTRLVAQHQPLFVTHVARSSLMSNPGFRATCEEGRARDGSSFVGTGRVAWVRHKPLLGRARAEVRVGCGAARDIAMGVRLNLPRGKPFIIVAGQETGLSERGTMQGLVFVPADRGGWFIDERDSEGRTLAISVVPSLVPAICASLEAASIGLLEWPDIPDFTMTIVADD